MGAWQATIVPKNTAAQSLFVTTGEIKTIVQLLDTAQITFETLTVLNDAAATLFLLNLPAPRIAATGGLQGAVYDLEGSSFSAGIKITTSTNCPVMVIWKDTSS